MVRLPIPWIAAASIFNNQRCFYCCIIELLRFIWPSPAEGGVETVLEFRPFDMAEQAVREKILLKMDLPTNVSNAM